MDQNIADDPLIHDRNPEDIANPSIKLDTILGRYFKVERKGKERAKKYSKTKDGPALISLLNLTLLSSTFDEVTRLIQYIKDKV